jgi:DNA-binding transcriptional ArsR family regulator
MSRWRTSKSMSVRLKGTPKPRAVQNCAPVFAALGDEMRLRLVAALCVGGAMSITQLTSGTEISRQAVTKHLSVLAGAGLVRDVKVGRERLWEFEPGQLDEARRSLELIGRQWEQALARLKLAVEADSVRGR